MINLYDITNVNLGEILRKQRKQKHLSLEYIGDHIYKTKATISKYEKGEIIPDFVTVLELCNVLDIDISKLAPSITGIYSSDLPFNTNTLYLYYLTSNKLISSTIKLELGVNNIYSAHFYNGIKNNAENPAYYYEGTVESSPTITYMNFRNISSDKMKLEQVQLIINMPLSNTSNYFNCFITGLTPNFLPIVKKGVITTAPLDTSKIDIKKLKISKEELQRISTDNAWILDTKIYDEFFYNEQ